MSDDVTRPWWYSGDEEPAQEAPEGESPEGASPAGDSPPEGSASEGAGRSGFDVMAMLSGAVRMMDWAAGTVVEPHADHQDPGAHPDCLICRTLVVVTDRTGMAAPSAQSPASEPRSPAEQVRWIPITD